MPARPCPIRARSALPGGQDGEVGDIDARGQRGGPCDRHGAKTWGTKRIHSAEHGDLSLRWEALAVTSAPGQIVVTYYAEPGSESDRRIRTIVADCARDAGT